MHKKWYLGFIQIILFQDTRFFKIYIYIEDSLCVPIECVITKGENISKGAICNMIVIYSNVPQDRFLRIYSLILLTSWPHKAIVDSLKQILIRLFCLKLYRTSGVRLFIVIIIIIISQSDHLTHWPQDHHHLVHNLHIYYLSVYMANLTNSPNVSILLSLSNIDNNNW